MGHLAGWLDLWGFPNEGVPHVDMVFTMVDVGLALIYPPFWDYGTIKYLKSQRISLIQVPADEYMTYVCNSMLLEPGKVIVPAAAKQTVKALKKEGVQCIEIEFPEGTKGFGGLHCVTCQLLRDPGPSLSDI